MVKKLLAITLILIISGAFAGYFFVYNKPHRKVPKEKASFSLTAKEFFNFYSTNESDANEKYLNQVIEVSGTISEITKKPDGEFEINLEVGEEMSSISCTFNQPGFEPTQALIVGEQITIKGLCIGMSVTEIGMGLGTLKDVKLVKCSIIE